MQVTIVLHLGNYNRAHIFSPQWTFCSRHSRYGTSRCLSSRCRLLSPLGDPEQGKKKLDLEPWRLPDTYSGPHLEQVWLLHCTKVYLWTPLPHTDSCNPFPPSPTSCPSIPIALCMGIAPQHGVLPMDTSLTASNASATCSQQDGCSVPWGT
jgi:hypothetical protein